MPKTARKATKKATKTSKRGKVAETVAKKIKSFKDPLTKSKLVETISDNTGVAKKDISSVLECLGDVINGHIKPRAAGKFTLPGLLTITVKKKKATKARKGINPFTGEEMMFKAKPAVNVVKIKPLKKLKEMAEK